MAALRFPGISALALILAGIGMLIAHDVVSAGNAMLHGRNASGVPYTSSPAQVYNNYTYYVNQYDTAASRWNSATNPDYFKKFVSGGPPMRQYMVYSRSQQDLDLATFFGAPSCKYWTDDYQFDDPLNDPENYRAFEFGHGSLNNDSKFTVVCLNVSALGYSVTFDCGCLSNEGRIKGISHEIGHSIHLDHDTAGVMSQCWCENIRQHDVDVVTWIYASPP